jgi:hypothetical protein
VIVDCSSSKLPNQSTSGLQAVDSARRATTSKSVSRIDSRIVVSVNLPAPVRAVMIHHLMVIDARNSQYQNLKLLRRVGYKVRLLFGTRSFIPSSAFVSRAFDTDTHLCSSGQFNPRRQSGLPKLFQIQMHSAPIHTRSASFIRHENDCRSFILKAAEPIGFRLIVLYWCTAFIFSTFFPVAASFRFRFSNHLIGIGLTLYLRDIFGHYDLPIMTFDAAGSIEQV